ncbi:MAG: RICIN domain-containing protein [Clostridia bacterium]|nr:RICIN domain-containing protein [Clostridia bacterium]
MQKRSIRFALIILICVMLIQPILIGFIAHAGDSDGVVTAVIHYYYYDENKIDHKGTEPFPAFVANMPQGSAPITQTSPTVLGFSPYTIGKVPLPSVTVTFDADSETDVFYFPTEVPYVIRLNKQDIGSDNYTVGEIIHGLGVTGTEPVEFGETFRIVQLDNKTLEEAYNGFTLMYHVPEVIAADGSTEFECYYDRNYYMVSVELGPGGYGVDPLYVPYEYPLSLGTPVRTGYTFDGWDIVRADTNEPLASLPATCPAYDIKCTARWNVIGEVGYTVVYCNADLDDGSGVTKYSHWGEKHLSALPDTEMTLASIIAANKDDITSYDNYQYFTFDETATAANNDGTVTIKSDGSTVIRLYYSRNKYKLRFIYARSRGMSAVPEVATTVSPGTYYLLNNRSNKVVTPNVSPDNGNYLAANVALSQNTANIWTIIDDGNGGYYLQASTGEYLVITAQKVYLTSTPTSTSITAHPGGTGLWKIYQGNSFLNDKSNQGKFAGPTTLQYANDAGSAYKLIPADPDGAFHSVVTYSPVDVPNRTKDGDIQHPEFRWDLNIGALPVVRSSWLSADADVKSTGTVVMTIGSTPYTMHYIDLVAEFGADIENLWPADAIEPVGERRFGSWSTEKGSGYRAHYSDHANIVGQYPYMSADMIVDPTCVYDPDNVDQVAQNLYAWWGNTSANIGPHRFKIYYETLDPNDYDIELNGVRYKLDRTQEIVAAHNKDTRIDPFAFVGYTILPSEAGGHSQSHNNGSDNGTPPHYKDTDGVWTTDFHYTRNRRSLGYYNYNAYYNPSTNVNGDPITGTDSIPYGQSLEGFEPDGIPPYPAGLAPDCYEFEGWYDSVTYDNPVDWSALMPDHDVVAYAYWKPKEFDVYFYNSESDYLAGQLSAIAHGYGTYGLRLDVSGAEALLVAPVITSSVGDYNAARAGWYYYDENGELHAFDPATMTVSCGMHLFMRWSSNVPAYFHVYYYVKNTTTEVAPDTFGYSFVGLTRTFKAKVEEALNDGYQEHYFPDKASTSILMQGDETLNVKTFWYTYRDHVPYTVRYVALDGVHAGEEIHASKYVEDNYKAIVTERFVHVPNYVPTAYYMSRTLIVSDDPAEEAEQNVIIFYYREDTINMPYHVSYLVEDESGNVTETIDGSTVHFVEKNFIDGYAERGSTQTVGVNTYGGYDVCGYKEISYATDETATDGALVPITSSTASVSVELTASLASKEIRIFYLKKTFPVKVIYQISSNDSEKIAEFDSIIEGLGIEGLQSDPESAVTVGGNTYYKTYYKIVPDRKFNSHHVETAPSVSGFVLAGNETRTRIISDDDANITNNRIVFTYTALNEVIYFYYSILPRGNTHVLGNPQNPKLLSINQEVVEIGERPNERCRAFLDNPIYTFVGWYNDEACTSPVTNTQYGSEYVLTPEAPGTENAILPLPANENRSYYAKFDFRRGDMTISVTDDAVTDGGQVFELIVRGQDEDNSWVNIRIALDPVGTGVTDTVTIKDLPVGNYTVTQNGWSWRYGDPTPSSKTVTVEDKELPESTTAAAAFTETFVKNKWLDGNAAADNDFGE